MLNTTYFSDEECLAEYKRWLNSDVVDDITKKSLEELVKDGTDQEQLEKIKLHFRSFLVFGTGGLRGIMGPGINNINVYTIMHATQGFADYINSLNYPDNKRKIVIGYDTRNNSKLYAQVASQVMAANNIHVLLFKDIRPTPEISFAIRKLNAVAGINVTASHNPKIYNGYKVYGNDGAQLLEDAADIVRKNMYNIDILHGIKTIPFSEALKANMITYIDDSIDDDFLNKIFEKLKPSDHIKELLSSLKFTFSPVHGAGYYMIPNILKRAGVKEENLHIISEQSTPNGDFPTVWFPNPELPSSYQLALEYTKNTNDDFVIISDPDADRVGMAIKNPNGWYTRLTGNQIGAMLLDYIIQNNLVDIAKRPNSYVIKTFVTTDLINKICESNNINMYVVLTGFKYIAEIIKNHEESDPDGKDYVFGFEESLGFLPGTFARDKDSVSSSLLICEMAAFYKEKNMTLYDALTDLYCRYGAFYEETIDNYMLDDKFGLTGEQKRDILMNKLRSNPPKTFGNEKIVKYTDLYEMKDTPTPKPGIINLITGEKSWTGITDSNVLIFETENKHRVCIRPSGTEPKIKVYFLMNGAYNNYSIDELKDLTIKFKQDAYNYGMITEEFLKPFSYGLPTSKEEFDLFNDHLKKLIQHF